MRISDWSSDVCSSDLWRDVDAIHLEAAETTRSHRVILQRRGDAGGCRELEIGNLAVEQRRSALGHDDHLAITLRNGTDRNFPCDLIDEVVPFIRSEEHTSELQSLMRISYAVFCLKKKTNK